MAAVLSDDRFADLIVREGSRIPGEALYTIHELNLMKLETYLVNIYLSGKSNLLIVLALVSRFVD